MFKVLNMCKILSLAQYHLVFGTHMVVQKLFCNFTIFSTPYRSKPVVFYLGVNLPSLGRKFFLTRSCKRKFILQDVATKRYLVRFLQTHKQKIFKKKIERSFSDDID